MSLLPTRWTGPQTAMAAVLVLVFGIAGYFAAGDTRPVVSVGRERRPLPSSMTWRIEGLTARGTAGAGHWVARAGKAYAVGASAGPFRFQALKTLVLENLHFELRPGPGGNSPAVSLRAGVDRLAESVAEQSQASRASIESLHVDIRDEAGNLRCCVRADRAAWKRKDGTGIELSGAVQVDREGGSMTSDAAQIRPDGSNIVSKGWAAGHGRAPAHPDETSAGPCPLEVETEAE